MSQRVNRLPSRLPPEAVTTYSLIRTAPAVVKVDIPCEDHGCPGYLYGFRSTIDEATELGQRQAWHIRNAAGRRYTEVRSGALTEFTFPAGQRCFVGSHDMTVAREPLYVVRGGDHRGNPRGERRVHARAADWRDDFGEHQETLSDQFKQG